MVERRLWGLLNGRAVAVDGKGNHDSGKKNGLRKAFPLEAQDVFSRSAWCFFWKRMVFFLEAHGVFSRSARCFTGRMSLGNWRGCFHLCSDCRMAICKSRMGRRESAENEMVIMGRVLSLNSVKKTGVFYEKFLSLCL